jgi:hypothetical protein
MNRIRRHLGRTADRPGLGSHHASSVSSGHQRHGHQHPYRERRHGQPPTNRFDLTRR